MHEELKSKISTYIDTRYKSKLEVRQKKYEKESNAAFNIEDKEKIEEDFLNDKAALQQQFSIRTWINDAARRAGQISLATHAVKFINSSIKASNLIDQNKGHDPRYLDTEGLTSKAIDVVGNAAALDVAGFLQLTDENGDALLDHLKKGDVSPLESWAENPEQAKEWLKGLSQAWSSTAPSSHNFAKQLYFPVGENEYHLLAPLYSSALSQVLYEKVQHARYSQEMKEIRAARRAKEFHADELIVYPDLAVTFAGGTKPQNISQLNNRRGGRTYLFSSQPPTWKQQIHLPLNVCTVFDHHSINNDTRKNVQRLAQFLVELNKTSANSNMRIRDYIERTVDEIIDQILSFTAVWKAFPAGWSNKSDLTQYQRQWLDPKNPKWDIYDDDWKKVVSEEFARWLKDKLNGHAHETFTLGQKEIDVWSKQFKHALSEVA